MDTSEQSSTPDKPPSPPTGSGIKKNNGPLFIWLPTTITGQRTTMNQDQHERFLEEYFHGPISSRPRDFFRKYPWVWKKLFEISGRILEKLQRTEGQYARLLIDAYDLTGNVEMPSLEDFTAGRTFSLIPWWETGQKDCESDFETAFAFFRNLGHELCWTDYQLKMLKAALSEARQLERESDGKPQVLEFQYRPKARNFDQLDVTDESGQHPWTKGIGTRVICTDEIWIDILPSDKV